MPDAPTQHPPAPPWYLGKPGIAQLDVLRRLSFWQLQLGGWILYLIVPLAMWFSGGAQSPEVQWLAFTRGASGFLFTSALRPLCLRIFRHGIRYPTFLPLLLVAAIALGILELEAMLLLGRLLGFTSAGLAPLEVYLGILLLRSIVLFLWLLLYFGLKSLRRSFEREREFGKAEARLLRAQMNPHFLFNALNTIMAVRKDAAKVELVTQSLADYLRFSLQQEQGLEQYALGQELDALQEYLRVEKARFGPDILWRIDAGEEARRTRVPSALVQPLLENAIKYGQETSPRPLRVSITAQVVRDQLLLEVENSGHWVEQGASRTGRIGLTNLKRRLALVYGEAASLDIRDTPSTVKVCLALPARPLR